MRNAVLAQSVSYGERNHRADRRDGISEPCEADRRDGISEMRGSTLCAAFSIALLLIFWYNKNRLWT